MQRGKLFVPTADFGIIRGVGLRKAMLLALAMIEMVIVTHVRACFLTSGSFADPTSHNDGPCSGVRGALPA